MSAPSKTTHTSFPAVIVAALIVAVPVTCTKLPVAVDRLMVEEEAIAVPFAWISDLTEKSWVKEPLVTVDHPNEIDHAT